MAMNELCQSSLKTSDLTVIMHLKFKMCAIFKTRSRKKVKGNFDTRTFYLARYIRNSN